MRSGTSVQSSASSNGRSSGSRRRQLVARGKGNQGDRESPDGSVTKVCIESPCCASNETGSADVTALIAGLRDVCVYVHPQGDDIFGSQDAPADVAAIVTDVAEVRMSKHV